MRVKFYETVSGRCPVLDYVDKQPVRVQARILEALSSIEESGLKASRVTFKQIKGKLWEIKIRFGGAHRIFYVMADKKTLVLLHAFLKKTNKTPQREIETAMTRMAEII